MNSILYLIPISLTLGICALCAFIWAVQSKQYEDLETEKYRILNKEDKPKK
ncbi:MAG: cytochrome oxidase maturation protein, cbb3-type [Methyloligella sp.]|nr:MAG: cytochrome oxidase maturation protein, cbb3-type [Methyloligella sp.]